MFRRLVSALALVLAVWPGHAGADPKVTVSHGLTLMDTLKYPADFKHLDYVNPNAPKGGTVKLFTIGAFDSLNPFIIKGNDAAGMGLVFETLMTSPLDDISAEYGLIAESVEVPDDLSYVVYNLRPQARFHDGTPITADDVVFSLETLKEKGAPHYRFYYANIVRAVAINPRKVKFEFTGPPNRELPQITGQLPVLSKAYWSSRNFDETTLERPLGSGPYKVGAFEPGRFITFERVKDYWGEKLPIQVGTNNFDVIRYDYYRDETVAMEAFKAGEYDFRTENQASRWATGYDFPALRDGAVIKRDVIHQRPTGMQAFAFNLRRDQFKDPRVREALGYAFDFEWTNKNLFYGQYTRTNSFFENSDLAADAPPSEAELKLLEPFRGKVPEQVFTTVYKPPQTDGSGTARQNLLRAQELLRAAGWEVKNNRLTEAKTGKAMEIEFLLVSPAFERIVSPFVNNLKRLGIQARIRTVDPSQYQNRVRDFDFDIVVQTFAQSLSPGNEQRDFWSSEAADRPGSRNVIGIKNPAVDALVEKVVEAHDRPSLVAASRALDRVLSWNHYVIPQWYIRADRIAYWDKFGIPPKNPAYGVAMMSWWIDPAKAAASDSRRSSR